MRLWSFEIRALMPLAAKQRSKHTSPQFAASLASPTEGVPESPRMRRKRRQPQCQLIRPFVPAKDFDLSKRFYEALGIEKLLDSDVAVFRLGRIGLGTCHSAGGRCPGLTGTARI